MLENITTRNGYERFFSLEQIFQFRIFDPVWSYLLNMTCRALEFFAVNNPNKALCLV